MESRRNSNGIFSQHSIRCRSAKKSKVYCTDWEKHQKISQKEFYLCRCSTTFLVEQKTMKKNVRQMLDSYFCMQKDLEKDNGHSLVLVLRKSGTLSWGQSTRNLGRNCRKDVVGIRWERMSNFPCYSSLSSSHVKSKGRGKLSIHYAADQETIHTIFRIIVSAHQVSLHAAVAEICGEYESFHERTERPVVMGQSNSSLVLSAIKTEVFLDSDDPAYKIFLLQQYGERIEKLSQPKDTGDLTQFNTVACREYTFPREDEASQPKGWIQGNTKIGPVLEVATSCLHVKYGVEIRIMSLNRQHSLLGQNFSWIKWVCDEFEQQWNRNSRRSARRVCVFSECKRFCMPIKGKSKTTTKRTCWFFTEHHSDERKWIDIEPGNYSLSAYEVSKKVTFLLRHSQQMRREEDGPIHFWRIKENLQNQFPQSIHWPDDRWKACLAAGGGV